jgi:hypothetical protein
MAARQLYIERWGESVSYLLNCSDSIPCESNDSLRCHLLEAARYGDRITVTASNRLGKELAREGFAALHGNISFHVLPRFFHDRALQRTIKRLAGEYGDFLRIIANEATPPQQGEISFADFSARLKRKRETFYQGGVHA